ncbi:MAG: monofunctional biosynthetic peptidoglycan transglycosylase [bacterium]|nr:monofunctional biosynthetic peptidoglycan transglycosylase [bacterium]
MTRKIRSLIKKVLYNWSYVAAALLLFIAADLGYIAGLCPDWDLYLKGPVFKSNFIKRYELQREENKWPPLKWQPVPIENISKNMIRAVVVAEDSRFYSHKGIDPVAFEEVIRANLSKRKFSHGGSTISQQTAKNVFLTPSKNPFRKWHELVLTFWMEMRLEKKRIMELYLNVAEFGKGIYGVEAAAKYYWGMPASDLSMEQAVELAATLPAPKSHNPKTRTSFFSKRKKKLLRQLAQFP